MPHVLVRIDPSGRRFAVDRLPRGGYVVEDVDEGRRLGALRGDLTPFIVSVGGAPHIICAGEQYDRATHHVFIDFHDGEPPEMCLVKHGVWLTAAHRFTPGMRVTASWHDSTDRELWRQQSPPLDADAPAPMYGPEWFRYELGESPPSR